MIFDTFKVTFGCFTDFSLSGTSRSLFRSDSPRLAPSKLSELLNIVSVSSPVRLVILTPSGFLKPLTALFHTQTQKRRNKSVLQKSFFFSQWVDFTSPLLLTASVFCFFCKPSPNWRWRRWSSCRDVSSIFLNFILFRDKGERRRHDFGAIRGGKWRTPLLYPPFFQVCAIITEDPSYCEEIMKCCCHLEMCCKYPFNKSGGWDFNLVC